MKGEIKASISAIAAALMLIACAAKGPAKPNELTSDAASEKDKTSAEYQRLVSNANNQLVCRRQSVTGSRIDSQVCMTRAQMKEQRERAEEVMRDMQSNSALNRQNIPDRPAMPTSMPRSGP
jgi:hypothetical protein